MFFIVKYISFFFPRQRKIFRIIFCQFTTKICWFKTDTIGENINIIVQVKINKKKERFFSYFFLNYIYNCCRLLKKKSPFELLPLSNTISHCFSFFFS